MVLVNGYHSSPAKIKLCSKRGIPSSEIVTIKESVIALPTTFGEEEYQQLAALTRRRQVGDDWVKLDESLHALHKVSEPTMQSLIEQVCEFLLLASMKLELGGL